MNYNNSNSYSNDSKNRKLKRLKTNSFQFGKCKICDDEATGFHYGGKYKTRKNKQ
jgi:hypothetical protein